MLMHDSRRIEPFYGTRESFGYYEHFIIQELKSIRNRQYDLSEILELAAARFNKLIKTAVLTCPFYRKVLKIEDFNSELSIIQKLSKFPYITKENLRDDFYNFWSDNTNLTPHLFKKSTSGTSGVPVTVMFDSSSINYRWITIARELEQLGAYFSKDNKHQNIVLVSSIEPYREGILPLPGRPRFIKIVIKGNLTREKQVFIDNLLRLKPCILTGTPTMLVNLAVLLQDNAISLNPPKVIISSGEKLESKTRSYLQKFFNTRVYDQYGMTEVGHLACECSRQDGLHFDSDRLLIQIMKADDILKDGELGEIIVTDLINHTMPIIRYRTGDLGVMSNHSCSCGVKYPRLMAIKGRIITYFQRSDGSFYDPCALDKYLRILGFNQYKLIQHNALEMELQYVGGDKSPNINKAKEAIIKEFGNVDITFLMVQRIITKSRATYVSKIRNPLYPI